MPDSAAGYTLTQTRDRFGVTDWHPSDYPAMPTVVARGRKPDVLACGFCHRADGSGGPENANLAGLPEAYIIQQMADYKSGARKSSVANRLPTDLMISSARAASDEEIAAAAKYFASIKPRKKINVIQADRVPVSYNAGWFFADAENNMLEALDNRILEVPMHLEQFESRDPRTRFIAYVPPGSVKRGKLLVNTGNDGKTILCVSCHGPQLQGLGTAPPITGRSPSYIFRQLFDFQSGARAGANAALMKPTVEKLTIDDMIAIAAFLTSRAP